jgi:hypothetical protein
MLNFERTTESAEPTRGRLMFVCARRGRKNYRCPLSAIKHLILRVCGRDKTGIDHAGIGMILFDNP